MKLSFIKDQVRARNAQKIMPINVKENKKARVETRAGFLNAHESV